MRETEEQSKEDEGACCPEDNWQQREQCPQEDEQPALRGDGAPHREKADGVVFIGGGGRHTTTRRAVTQCTARRTTTRSVQGRTRDSNGGEDRRRKTSTALSSAFYPPREFVLSGSPIATDAVPESRHRPGALGNLVSAVFDAALAEGRGQRLHGLHGDERAGIAHARHYEWDFPQYGPESPVLLAWLVHPPPAKPEKQDMQVKRLQMRRMRQRQRAQGQGGPSQEFLPGQSMQSMGGMGDMQDAIVVSVPPQVCRSRRQICPPLLPRPASHVGAMGMGMGMSVSRRGMSSSDTSPVRATNAGVGNVDSADWLNSIATRLAAPYRRAGHEHGVGGRMSAQMRVASWRRYARMWRWKGKEDEMRREDDVAYVAVASNQL
ncbi:hypothetical protein FOMPIDRAFT_117432 [Fomitopsis schrenkii]|nr:hypothetical protein FOMPIDRAFT_117432 [Fomitopsis schrenkii]